MRMRLRVRWLIFHHPSRLPRLGVQLTANLTNVFGQTLEQRRRAEQNVDARRDSAQANDEAVPERDRQADDLGLDRHGHHFTAAIGGRGLPGALKSPMDTRPIRWAMHAADALRIEQLPGISDWTFQGPRIPEVGLTLTMPHFVDPQTRQPVQVIVSAVLLDYSPEYIVIQITRAQ